MKKKPLVAFQDAFKIFLKLPRWTSASQVFVVSNVPAFRALLRNYMYKFMCCLNESRNSIVRAVTVITTVITHGDTTVVQVFMNIAISVLIFVSFVFVFL